MSERAEQAAASGAPVRAGPEYPREPVVLLGGGGHARVCASIARRDGVLRLSGYADPRDRGDLDGLPWLGPDEEVRERWPECRLLLGIGLMTDARVRWLAWRRYGGEGGRFVQLRSRRASVAREAVLGAGTVVFDLAAINAGAVLGAACIVNTGAVVEHDCRLGDNVHIAPRATLCGAAQVGDHTLIGAGAVVLPGVRVAPGSIVAAGAVLTRDAAEPGLYLGVPAALRGRGMPG